MHTHMSNTLTTKQIKKNIDRQDNLIQVYVYITAIIEVNIYL